MIRSSKPTDTMDQDAATLKDLQDRLHTHFRSLASTRERSGFPIFALEHGLGAEQLSQINTLLRVRIRRRLPLAPHWLLWVIYASEAGYGYKGDELWSSFEKQTPNWQYHDRPKIKAYFIRFQKLYNGVVPTGLWAEHFSIIAWPITHALLPQYLQHQFARLLYELRFRLATTSGLDAGSIGRLLRAHGSHTSTRVQEFLQQEDLTGQIVAALLRGGSVDTEEPIHAQTLTRVVKDLERVRSSRKWLKETRRVVSDRFKGIGRGIYPDPTPRPRPGQPVLTNIKRFVIRPNLFLRHAGQGNWSAVLQLKSLRTIAAESPQLRSFLDTTRCRLNGASDWKPTGWLLSGDRKGAIRRWPDSNNPLINFERPDPLMQHLLDSEYRLQTGPFWLFRIGSDGIARHVASSTVRPAHDYIVVTDRTMPRELPGSSPCALQCEGVRAFRLSVPESVTAETTARLTEARLHVARTIHVWPAGLPGRGWDGDGRTEWLTTESPCFGIAPDHPVDALTFRFNGGPERILDTPPHGAPMFVRLPPQPAGNHTLTVEAHRSAELDHAVSTPPATGYARLAVREPEPWIPGIASHAGLIVTTDPFDASLDIFWRNELNLSVTGPKDYAVSIYVSLYTADGRKTLSEPVGPPMDLPIKPDDWRRVFAKFVDNKNRAWKYLEAATCTLEIRGDSLGTSSHTFDHAPSPLRWVMNSKKRQTIIRLVDDTGLHDDPPEIKFYNMKRPLVANPLNPDSARAGQSVPPPGGLFLARLRNFNDAAIVSAPPPRPDLQDLGVVPNVHISKSPTALRNAFGLLRLWHDARQTGFLADIKHRQVMRSIVDAIFAAICSNTWITAENNYIDSPASRTALQTLEARVDKRTQFGRQLRQHSRSGNTETAVATRFAALAVRHGISHDRDLCFFALRFANHPLDVLPDPALQDRIALLTQNPALLRGARLLSLLREHDRGPPASRPTVSTRP